MFSKVDYVMVNVSDMSRSVAFYRDTLGLVLKFESPGWSEFETGGTTPFAPCCSSSDQPRATPGQAGGGDVLPRVLRAEPR